MSRIVLFLTAFLLFGVAVGADAQTGITREQARSLVRTTLRLRGDRVAGTQIQESMNKIPGYYSFGAYRMTGNNLQDVVGWFAVNKRTGQVWDTTSCDLYAFPRLERQRRRLVRRGKRSRLKSPCATGQRAHIIRKRPVRRSAELPEASR